MAGGGAIKGICFFGEGDDKNVLKLDVVISAHLCEYAKNI